MYSIDIRHSLQGLADTIQTMFVRGNQYQMTLHIIVCCRLQILQQQISIWRGEVYENQFFGGK